MGIHAIDEITDNQCNIQENSSSWEEQLVLQPLLQEPENLDEYVINSPASMTIGEPPTSHDINNTLVVNNISLDSSELSIVNEISSESSDIGIKKKKKCRQTVKQHNKEKIKNFATKR